MFRFLELSLKRDNDIHAIGIYCINVEPSLYMVKLRSHNLFGLCELLCEKKGTAVACDLGDVKFYK